MSTAWLLNDNQQPCSFQSTDIIFTVHYFIIPNQRCNFKHYFPFFFPPRSMSWSGKVNNQIQRWRHSFERRMEPVYSIICANLVIDFFVKTGLWLKKWTLNFIIPRPVRLIPKISKWNFVAITQPHQQSKKRWRRKK